MSIFDRHQRKQRRLRFARGWRPRRNREPAAADLFEASFELAEASRDLVAAAGARGTSPATGASLSAASAAFESQAEAIERMRGLVSHELAGPAPTGEAGLEREHLHELLESTERALRSAADEAARARGAADSLAERRLSAVA